MDPPWPFFGFELCGQQNLTVRLALNSNQYFSLTPLPFPLLHKLIISRLHNFFPIFPTPPPLPPPPLPPLSTTSQWILIFNQPIKNQAINRFKNNLTTCPTGIAGQVNKFYAQKRRSNQALLYHWGCWGSVTARIIQSGSPLTSWDSYLSCSFLSIPFSYIFNGPQCKLLGYQ